jgi:hypothetical protein
MTTAMLDIATGWQERMTRQHYMLQTVPGDTISFLKKSLIELILGRSPIHI